MGDGVSTRPIKATPATQELRIATAMAGGVSLAIWMGGVARELNLLQRASKHRAPDDGQEARIPEHDSAVPADPDAQVEDLYLRLLELMDTIVDVDVLAGTSAGGINAALLGLARANDVSLGPLRDTWLEVGGFDRLLRKPAEENPSSLLQGDGVLLTGLQQGIRRILGTGSNTTKSTDTRVFITTTLLFAETSRFTDAYGTLVQDNDHHGLFRFTDDDLQVGGPRNEQGERVISTLATAARSSASYPFAFEPGFVSLDGEDKRPAMRSYANITRSHLGCRWRTADEPTDQPVAAGDLRPASGSVRASRAAVRHANGG